MITIIGQQLRNLNRYIICKQHKELCNLQTSEAVSSVTFIPCPPHIVSYIYIYMVGALGEKCLDKLKSSR